MGPLTGMLFRQHASRGRLIAMGAVGAIVTLLGIAIMVGDGGGSAASDLVREAGFALLVPVTAVVFATSVLGDPAEDGTIGYLLTTPRPRWQITVPALVATSAALVPLAVIPLVVVLVLNGVDLASILAVAVASALGAATYGSLFTALGVRFRRALLAGLLYSALWEGVVARFGTGLARLSVRQYALSVQAGMEGGAPPPGGVSATTAVVVLLALTMVGVTLTTQFLRTHETRS